MTERTPKTVAVQEATDALEKMGLSGNETRALLEQAQGQVDAENHHGNEGSESPQTPMAGVL